MACHIETLPNEIDEEADEDQEQRGLRNDVLVVDYGKNKNDHIHHRAEKLEIIQGHDKPQVGKKILEFLHDIAVIKTKMIEFRVKSLEFRVGGKLRVESI